MNKEYYPFRAIANTNLFVFSSEGIHGSIEKLVSITPSKNWLRKSSSQTIYNLAFGDLKTINGTWSFDDSVRSNNGDMPKVIATVARIAMEFLWKNEEAILSFSGYLDKKSLMLGRNQRTNLYQRAINSNLLELSEHFDMIGVNKKQEERYTVGCTYDTIMIKCKK